MDLKEQRVTFPLRDRHRNEEGHMPASLRVPSSSKLPRLIGDTRRHFPVRQATKGKQLGVGSHTYQAFQSYMQYAQYVQIQHCITTELYDSKYFI